MKYFLAAMLILISAAVNAQQAQRTVYFEWETPTAREDGYALPKSEIQGYRITIKSSDGTPVLVKNIMNPDAIATEVDATNWPAQYGWGAYPATIATVDTEDLWSKESDSVDVTLNGSPNPPDVMRVEVKYIYLSP